MQHSPRIHRPGARAALTLWAGQASTHEASVVVSSDRTITLMTDMIVDAQPGVPVIAQIEQSTLSTVVLRSLSGEAGTMLVLSNVADHERRRFGRISHAVPVTVEATGGGPSYQGRCRDISAAGLMITDATSSGGESLNPQLGERYFVAVDAGPDRVLAVATVVGTVGAVSLRFEAISETYRGALVKLIADTTNRHD